MGRKQRHLVVAGAIGALTLAMVLPTITFVSAGGASPKLTVKPTKNLPNDSVVSVSGKGFTPGDNVYVIECVIGETSTSGSGCNIAGLVGPEAISKKGVLSKVSFTVLTGKIGTLGGTCGTTASNAGDCDVSVGNPSGGDAASVPITFKVTS